MLAVGLPAASQTNYFVYRTDDGTDTIFTKKIDYKVTAQGNLSRIQYTDLEGKTWEMEGRKNLENVETFYIGGGWTDKIPQKTNRPDSYVRWASRVVDGKLKVNHYSHTISSNSFSSGFIKFYIKLPDGVFYDIDKGRDMKEHIIPYLKQCDAFNAAYKGDFDNEFNQFVKMIQLYNSVCP